ncbi:MAG: energy transducer TonB [Candidatus Acidiferrales bacterium]
MFARRTVAFLLSLSICALVSPKTALAQEPADLGKLPSNIADAIRKSAKSASGDTTVFVLDFTTGSHANNTELGHALATELADSLRKQAQGFTVLSLSDLKQPLAKLNLRDTILSSNALTCYASDLGVSVFIAGTMDDNPDGLVLHVRGWTPGLDQTVFTKKANLPMTASMKDFLSKAVPGPTQFFIDETHVWVSPDNPPPSDSEPLSLLPHDKRSSQPQCIHCPSPPFPAQATDARFQGTVVLHAQISPDGTVSKIEVVHGLPCGLTDQAIETVAHWRFKPARRPDGEPIAVEMPVEVSFRLY